MATSYQGTGATLTLGTFDGRIDSISCSGATRDQIEVSHMLSTNDWKEFKSGLIDGGSISVTCHYDPDATDPPVFSDEAVALKIDVGGTLGIACNINVAGITAAIDKGSVYEQTFELKVDGEIDFSGALA